MTWTHVGVLALLMIEGVGGVVIGALTAIIGEAITPGYYPWSFSAGPLVFGLATLAIAVAYWRRLPAARYLAVVIQVLVAVWATFALAADSPPTLWLVLALGVTGTVLVALDAARERLQ